MSSGGMLFTAVSAFYITGLQLLSGNMGMIGL
jgi:hypothetical protein